MQISLNRFLVVKLETCIISLISQQSSQMIESQMASPLVLDMLCMSLCMVNSQEQFVMQERVMMAAHTVGMFKLLCILQD